MRYLSVPVREAFESRTISRYFGKFYDPAADVYLDNASRLAAPGVELIDLDEETVAIAPDTASWAFLTEAEADSFRDLHKEPFGSIAAAWAADAPARPEDFVARLYRRGLLTINDQSAVDPTIFDDSPNVPEGNLVELLLTERCNLGCTYCLAGTNARMPRMTPEVARRTIDLAYAMEHAEVLAFEFSGGEPMLEYALMKDLVVYIEEHPRRRGRQVHLNVQTNATLLNRERVEWLRDKNVRVGLSVDGRPESQNVSRPLLGGGESYPRLMDGIDLLQRVGVPFGALVVLNRSNIESARELADFLVENGIRSFKLNPVAYLGTARGNWTDVGVTQEEVVAYFQEFLDLIVRDTYPLLEDNLRTMCEFLVSKQRSTRCLRSHCGAGDTFQAVSASGDIYPCGRATQSPGLRLGNVLDRQLPMLSSAAQQSPVIAEIRDRRPRTLEGCVVCPYRQMCQAGCSAQAFERYGTVRHRTPECHFYKTMYPYLMRRLAFDPDAVQVMNRVGYFGGEGTVVRRDHIARARTHA